MKKRLLDMLKNATAGNAPMPVSAEFLRRYALWQAAQPTPAPTPLTYAPRISIIAENPAAARAVRKAQDYPHAELCAPEGAQGDYVLYLFDGDALAPGALRALAGALNCPHKPDLLYADEDHPLGRERCPVFKNALNEPDLLARDCIGRPLLVSRALFAAAGPMRGWTDADGYDYALRCALRCVKPQHIPTVLLHRSRAPQMDASAAREALDRYLARREQRGFAVEGRSGTFRIRLPEKALAEVGIVIPNKNNAAALRMLLESIEQNALYPHYRIMIVDYGTEDLSTLRYYELLEANKAARVLRAGEAGFAKLWNLGARRVHTPLLLFMKPGSEVLSPAFLLPMMELALRPGIGAVGCLLTDAQDRPLAPPGLGQDLYNALYFLQDGIHAVTLLRGGCMMLRSDVFFDAGGFDETFTSRSELALCATLSRRGRVNAFTPDARVTLRESMERPPDARDKMRLKDALRPLKQGDPFLSGLWEEVWSIR